MSSGVCRLKSGPLRSAFVPSPHMTSLQRIQMKFGDLDTIMSHLSPKGDFAMCVEFQQLSLPALKVGLVMPSTVHHLL